MIVRVLRSAEASRMRSLLLISAALSAAAAAAPACLTVSGSQLLDEHQKPIRLTGFNYQLGRTKPGEGVFDV